MGRRRDKIDKRDARAAAARSKNSAKKAAEKLRRQKSMMAIVKKGKFPYTPGVMCWLSDRLGKKASKITSADVKALLKKSQV